MEQKGRWIYRKNMCRWRTCTLEEVAEIIPGFAFKGKHPGNEGAHVIKIKDVVPPYVDLNTARKVNLSHYSRERLEKYRLQRGQTVVAMTGATIGKIGKLLSDEVVYVNQRVAKILPKEENDIEFINHAISSKSFQSFIQSNIDSNSAQENISGTSIGKFPILLPTRTKSHRFRAEQSRR